MEMLDFKGYINESWSLDQMRIAEEQLLQAFRGTARLGFYEDYGDMEARLIVFVSETSMQLIQNTLFALGYEYISSVDVTDGVNYEGFLRDQVDLLVRKGTLSAQGGIIPGHFIGIYCDQEAGVSYGLDGEPVEGSTD
jgi:hypothetical protein